MPLAKVVENVTYKINAVEIFSTGVWNGTKITTKDLNDMVAAFEELKEGVRPFLKFGHADEQKLAQKTGLPAIGWVTNLYTRGDKLLADFDYIPAKVFNLLQSRAYRKVSCEVYFNITIEGKKYPKVLGAVALLGAETPGVMNLDDILGQYDFNKLFASVQNPDNVISYSFENPYNLTEGTRMPTEREIALEAELAAEKAKSAKAEADKQAFEIKQTADQKELQELRDGKLKAEAEAETARKEAFITKLEAEKLVTPAMKPLMVELMGDVKQEYSVADKKLSREDLVKEVLSLAREAAKVNFKENSSADFDKKDGKDEAIKEEIKKYQDAHKCDYASAHKAVMKKHGAAKAPVADGKGE